MRTWSFSKFSVVLAILATALSGCQDIQPNPPRAPANLPFDFTIAAYNTWLRPQEFKVTISGVVTIKPFQDQQTWRAVQIPSKLPGYDAIVLSEVFDAPARELIVHGLTADMNYPHHTDVFGDDKHLMSGGVMIAVGEKWSILNQDHVIYKDGVGPDAMAAKGAAYVLLGNSQGSRVHLFGTHAQSDVDWLEGAVTKPLLVDGDPAATRVNQFTQLRQFIDAKTAGSPSSEPVIIAGDMNVDFFNTAEYQNMLNILSASHPPGDRTHTNSTQYIDYILFMQGHRQPSTASIMTKFIKGTSDRQVCEQVTVQPKCEGPLGIPLPSALCKSVIQTVCKMLSDNQNLSDHNAVESYFHFE